MYVYFNFKQVVSDDFHQFLNILQIGNHQELDEEEEEKVQRAWDVVWTMELPEAEVVVAQLERWVETKVKEKTNPNMIYPFHWINTIQLIKALPITFFTLLAWLN